MTGHGSVTGGRGGAGVGVWLRGCSGGSGGRFEGDGVAEGFELADVVAFLGVGIGVGGVVVGAEVVESAHSVTPSARLDHGLNDHRTTTSRERPRIDFQPGTGSPQG